jgi:hypothetical protein
LDGSSPSPSGSRSVADAALGVGQQQHELQLAVRDGRRDPWTTAAKNGSENSRLSGSDTTSAIVLVRPVTRLRAAGLGT